MNTLQSTNAPNQHQHWNQILMNTQPQQHISTITVPQIQQMHAQPQQQYSTISVPQIHQIYSSNQQPQQIIPTTFCQPMQEHFPGGIAPNKIQLANSIEPY